MDLAKIRKMSRTLKSAYDQMDRKKGKEIWTARDYADGLAGDTGDFIKILLNYSKNPTRDRKKQLHHELADCLWSILMLAEELDIDIEKELMINMGYMKQKYYELSNINKNNKKIK